MGFEHLWPLLFLAFVPGIVLLYLLKQKVQTKKVPALNLWQEAFESVQASTPWEKFRNHLLMYLQIAVLLLLVFAMLMPYTNGRAARRITLFCVLTPVEA